MKIHLGPATATCVSLTYRMIQLPVIYCSSTCFLFLQLGFSFLKFCSPNLSKWSDRHMQRSFPTLWWMEPGFQDDDEAQCSGERHSKWDFVTDEMRDLTSQINQQLPPLTERKNGKLCYSIWCFLTWQGSASRSYNMPVVCNSFVNLHQFSLRDL